MVVPRASAEEARAAMIALAPGGFEEVDRGPDLELALYGDAGSERRLRRAFADAHVDVAPVAPGWETRWRTFHHPVRLGSLWIGPPWRRPPPGTVPVVVDPGRAFGTGAHATTRLCLELLAELPRGALLDVGCGSGVLAIAAARLGFAPVVALDSDPNAVEAAALNASANGVEVEVRRADALVDDLPAADVAVANIAHAVVEGVARRLRAPLAVASGYRGEDEPSLPGWRRRERRERDGWAADVLERVTD